MSLVTAEFLVILLGLLLAPSEQQIVRDGTKGLFYANFIKTENKKLDTEKIETLSVRQPSECGSRCVNTRNCVSTNYGKNEDSDGKHSCELLATNKFTSPQEMNDDEGFEHFSVVSKCDKEPCLNNGTCVPLYEENSYKCQCSSRFNGSICEKEMTPADHCGEGVDALEESAEERRSRPGNWTAFWWFDANATWPSNETDVLAYEFGHCCPQDPYCFGRIPSQANEDSTELLAVDSEGTEYKWRFSSGNPTAHAAWQAFHDHATIASGVVRHSGIWAPEVLNGELPKKDLDSFMYREESGVMSVMLDDDNCDCDTSLSFGHGMCHSSSGNSPQDQFGVDTLYESAGCASPRPGIGLTLYFRINNE